jgi:hypothetical protein
VSGRIPGKSGISKKGALNRALSTFCQQKQVFACISLDGTTVPMYNLFTDFIYHRSRGLCYEKDKNLGHSVAGDQPGLYFRL